jgi:hypothetical protein
MPLNVQVKSHIWIELETVLDEVVLPLPESVLPQELSFMKGEVESLTDSAVCRKLNEEEEEEEESLDAVETVDEECALKFYHRHLLCHVLLT